MQASTAQIFAPELSATLATAEPSPFASAANGELADSAPILVHYAVEH